MERRRVGTWESSTARLRSSPARGGCAASGVTDTSRMDVLGYPRDERWERLEASIPLRRAASDDEIADVIAFLCTPKGAYINGQSINVCGGMVMW